MSDNVGNLYGMTPSESANLAGLILFTLLWAYHSGTMWYRQWWFSIAIWIGCGLEVAGYIGRWESSKDPNILDDFLVQIICLTLAPAFIMGGIYYQLAKLVMIYGEKYSVLKPMHYSALFIACDVISIVIQAVGGAMAATAVQDNKDTDNGTHIMEAGIAFQVLSMSIFIIFFVIFMWRVAHATEFNPDYQHLRTRRAFKLFPYAIALCVLFVYIRCIYRVVELAEGWSGYLITHEVYFLVLDGLMILLGVFAVSIVHPGFALGRDHIGVNGFNGNKKSKKNKDHNESSLESDHSV